MNYLCELCERTCKDKASCIKNPRLNLGSGLILLRDHINFDKVLIKNKESRTDIIGDIKNIKSIFKPDTFFSIYCTHVLEHFYPKDGIRVLRDCYDLLKPDGVLVIECPDIAKIMKLFVSGKSDISKTIFEIYGDERFIPEYGESWMHKWGWTVDSCTQSMKSIGFTIKKTSAGVAHYHEERDFRVEGIKI